MDDGLKKKNVFLLKKTNVFLFCFALLSGTHIHPKKNAFNIEDAEFDYRMRCMPVFFPRFYEY